jgi:hypothetical protein
VDSLPTRTIITAHDADIVLTPAVNVLPHFRNGLARPALSTATKLTGRRWRPSLPCWRAFCRAAGAAAQCLRCGSLFGVSPRVD